ncbi:unnamed protein product, partial [Prorocentrum cordatum]
DDFVPEKGKDKWSACLALLHSGGSVGAACNSTEDDCDCDDVIHGSEVVIAKEDGTNSGSASLALFQPTLRRDGPEFQPAAEARKARHSLQTLHEL